MWPLCPWILSATGRSGNLLKYSHDTEILLCFGKDDTLNTKMLHVPTKAINTKSIGTGFPGGQLPTYRRPIAEFQVLAIRSSLFATIGGSSVMD